MIPGFAKPFAWNHHVVKEDVENLKHQTDIEAE